MITDDDSLKELQLCAGKLASAAESLAALFEEEGIRLKRGDQVARLKSLHAAVMRHMEEAKYDERIAGYSYSSLKSIRRTAGVVTGWFSKTDNDVPGVISHAILGPPAAGEPPFGTVLVRIGPGGVPDDVHIVSVSRLARESHRKESEVIEEMQKAKTICLPKRTSPGLWLGWLKKSWRGD